ncbi:hypothetical protein [Bacillus niameyensis]|uniref:hypothetical protein n=1 Tax=Bacillus niameyensis TaxID=1522308 RepID=UPI00078393E1|nr:hypothetical protein [Bacillus niameyensis]
MASITFKEIIIKDVKVDTMRFYSSETIKKYYSALTNGTTTCVIKVEKVKNDYFLIGGFPYYYAALIKSPYTKVKCQVHEYKNPKQRDRLIRALNNAFVERNRDWYLFNFLINQLNELGVSDNEIADKLRLELTTITSYKLNNKMKPFYQEYAAINKVERLFNCIHDSPISDQHKEFLYNVAIKNRSLTQSAVKEFCKYIKEGYVFDVESEFADSIFLEILDYNSYKKSNYWRVISEKQSRNDGSQNKSFEYDNNNFSSYFN